MDEAKAVGERDVVRSLDFVATVRRALALRDDVNGDCSRTNAAWKCCDDDADDDDMFWCCDRRATMTLTSAISPQHRRHRRRASHRDHARDYEFA